MTSLTDGVRPSVDRLKRPFAVPIRPPPSNPPVLYFAYGSNMLTERLGERVPSARPVGPAELAGYALRFLKRSQDGSAKCTIVPAPDASRLCPVHGVCFEITADHLADLDRAEGRGSGYRRTRAEVFHREAIRAAATYVAEPEAIDDTLHPYRWYRALVIAGAMQHDLPDAYVTALRRVEALPDPHAKRRRKSEAHLRAAGFRLSDFVAG